VAVGAFAEPAFSRATVSVYDGRQARLGYLAAACGTLGIAKRPTANRAFDQIRRGPPGPWHRRAGCCNFVLLVRPSDQPFERCQVNYVRMLNEST